MDERSVRNEMEGYLRTNDLNEYFTSIIESCLMATPINPSLHIIVHLFKTYPDQIPPTIAAAIDAHLTGSNKGLPPEGPKSMKGEDSQRGRDNTPSSQEVADTVVAKEPEQFSDDDIDDIDELESPLDAALLKQMAVAADGGIHVTFGGWKTAETGHEENDDLDDSRDDIYGGDVHTRAELAVKKLRAMAQQRGTRAIVLRRHPSAGWRDGRRHAVSFPTPAPAPAPSPPEKLMPFLTRVRRDQPFLEVLLPALARCRLCADLTDFQLILLGEACGPPLTADPGTVVVAAGPAHERAARSAAANDDDMLDSLIVVMSGTLTVREVAAPALPHPRFDDGRQFRDAHLATSSAQGSSVLGGGGGGSGSSVGGDGGSGARRDGGGGIVLRDLKRLRVGDTYGEHALFAPHEHFAALARASQTEDGGSLGYGDPAAGSNDGSGDGVNHADSATAGGGGDGGGGSPSDSTPPTAQEVVVPPSAGEGCRYWRLPRRTLHALRVQWQRDDEDMRVAALRGVPALAYSLSELELRQVAALGEERRFLPGEVVCSEGALLENLEIVLQGFCSFERRGDILMETVGAGAYWGDLSLVQGPRLCQATVKAAPQKILSAHGPIPIVFRETQDQAPSKSQGAAKAGSEDPDTTPALVVLVVRVRILERIMGPLVDLLRRHPAPKQAGIFSRIVC